MNQVSQFPGKHETVKVIVEERVSLFSPVGTKAVALLRQGGGYLEAPLYSYNNELYAKAGSKMLKLKAHGETSQKSTVWTSLHGISSWEIGPFGLKI
jgi:hypothetical protein